MGKGVHLRPMVTLASGTLRTWLGMMCSVCLNHQALGMIDDWRGIRGEVEDLTLEGDGAEDSVEAAHTVGGREDDLVASLEAVTDLTDVEVGGIEGGGVGGLEGVGSAGVDEGEVGLGAELGVGDVELLGVLGLEGLNLGADLGGDEGEDLGGGETGVGGVQDEHGADAAGHADGGVEVGSGEGLAVGGADDHGGGAVGVGESGEGVGAAGDGDVDLGLAGGLVLLPMSARGETYLDDLEEAGGGLVGGGDALLDAEAEALDMDGAHWAHTRQDFSIFSAWGRSDSEPMKMTTKGADMLD